MNADLAELTRAGGPQATIIGQFLADKAHGILRGPLAEEARRERGHSVVLPLGVESTRGSPYWVAYLEEWDLVERTKYRFRSANLTFYQGAEGQYQKTQLFRAEWPGFTDWGDGQPGWQAIGAGHPHWQFDALNAYLSREAREADVARMLDVLHQTGGIEEFGAEDVPVLRELTFEQDEDLAWTRMHFASQAYWSTNPWQGDRARLEGHAHAPATLTQIRDWLTSVICYARHELGR